MSGLCNKHDTRGVRPGVRGAIARTKVGGDLRYTAGGLRQKGRRLEVRSQRRGKALCICIHYMQLTAGKAANWPHLWRGGRN